MRLTQFTDYALRLLLFMAANEGRRITIAEVAEANAISRHHLMKVAHRLAKTGILTPSRGRTGGLKLARPPEAITLGEVLRATEPDFALVACMAGERCALAPNCKLPHALDEALSAFLSTADRRSIASLIC